MTTWSWKQKIWESNLSATTKIVLQALASHLNDFGDPMFPSQERLAKLCSLSERAVITHLQVAEEQGWIKPRKRELKGKKWAANEYIACWPDGVNDVPMRGEGRSPDGVKDVHTNNPSLILQENNPPTPKGEPVGFNEFWQAYPLKVGKPKALNAWKRLKPDLDTVLNGLKRWKASDQWTKDNGQFIPHPSTWLNREGWNDAIPGEVAPMSPADLEASRLRSEQARRENDARFERLKEERRREMGLTA